MQITNRMSVKPKWDTFTYPIKRGTPISITGQLSNNGNAVGIVPETIEKKPDYDQYLYLMTGGSANLSEIAYTDLSVAAMQAMNGIKFFGTDGTPAADPVYDQYVLPAAAADALGGVMLADNVAAVSDEGDLADAIGAINDILDALKAAGIMVADAEP